MKGIFRETLIEFFGRRQHWLLLLVTVMAVAAIYYAVNDKIELVQNEISSQNSLILSASSSLSNLMTVLVMLSVVSTIFLIPRLLLKGRVEFYLSKPITRSTLFYGKVISLITIYGFMISMCGTLAAGVLAYLGVLSFSGSVYILVTGLAAFLVWFSVISFTGFLTKSVPLCFTVLGGFWVIQLLLKHRAEWGIEQNIARFALDFFYQILPKTSEMSGLSVQLASGVGTANYLPAFTSLALAGLLLYSAHTVFIRRDF